MLRRIHPADGIPGRNNELDRSRVEVGLAETVDGGLDDGAVLGAVEAVAVVVGTDGDVGVEDGEVDCHFFLYLYLCL